MQADLMSLSEGSFPPFHVRIETDPVFEIFCCFWNTG